MLENIKKEEYLTACEAGKILHLTCRQIHGLCVKGKIEGSKKAGSVWMIPRSTLEKIRVYEDNIKSQQNIKHVTEVSQWNN